MGCGLMVIKRRKNMEKKYLYYIGIGSIVIVIGLVIVLVFISNNKTTNKKNEIGTISVDEVSSTVEDYYDATEENVTIDTRNHVAFKDLELVYDILTLEALSNINIETSKFLNEDGYSDITELTVDSSSIISEKGYPRFICDMTGSNSRLEIRYNLEKQSFEFAIK